MSVDARIPSEYQSLWKPCEKDMTLFHLTTRKGLEGIQSMGHIEPRDPSPRNWAGMRAIFMADSTDPLYYESLPKVLAHAKKKGEDLFRLHIRTHNKLYQSTDPERTFQIISLDPIPLSEIIKIELIDHHETSPTLITHFAFPNCTLHEIQEADVAPTINLINKAYSYQDAYKEEPRINREKLLKQIQKSDFYVVKENDEVVGCLYLRDKNGALHFGLLTVDEAHRGKGLAPALMRALEEYAVANSYPSIQLDYMSVSPWLKKYYEKYGFVETGEVEKWGNIDLIQMRKQLVS